MGNFYFSVNCSDLINGLNLRTQSSVNTECLSINHGSNGKVVKNIGAVFPGVGVSIFSINLIVEAIDCGDLSILQAKYLD